MWGYANEMPVLPDTFLGGMIAGLRHHILGLSHSLYFPPEVKPACI